MPIAATMSALQSLLQNVFNSGIAGKPELSSLTYANAIASIAPSGLFPAGSAMIPLVPAGFSACQSLLQNAFNSGLAGTPDLTSVLVATAISVLCPMVPPSGLSTLQSLLQNVYASDVAGTPDLTSMMEANAIISYFMSCGVI